MNAFVRKEIRNLLPSFALAIAAALTWWVLPSAETSRFHRLFWILPIACCPGLVLMMCMESFGREFSSGNVTHLLSQPISRARIWWTKTLLLLGAVSAVFCVWFVSVILAAPSAFAGANDGMDLIAWSAVVALLCLSGGLWTVLLLRHTGIAFWVAILIPAAIAVSIVHWADRQGVAAGERLLAVWLGYAVVGFVLAWRLFLRLQDLQWTGGTIQMPWLAGGKSATNAVRSTVRRIGPSVRYSAVNCAFMNRSSSLLVLL